MRLMTNAALTGLSVSGGLLLGVFYPQPAIAQCVQADVGVQYNVSGSRVPTRRRNNVKMRGRGRCRGNTSVTTGVQGNVGGTAPVTQRRRVIHDFRGDGPGNSGDIIQIKVNPQIDVYNPADRYRK